MEKESIIFVYLFWKNCLRSDKYWWFIISSLYLDTKFYLFLQQTQIPVQSFIMFTWVKFMLEVLFKTGNPHKLLEYFNFLYIYVLDLLLTFIISPILIRFSLSILDLSLRAATTKIVNSASEIQTAWRTAIAWGQWGNWLYLFYCSSHQQSILVPKHFWLVYTSHLISEPIILDIGLLRW